MQCGFSPVLISSMPNSLLSSARLCPTSVCRSEASYWVVYLFFGNCPCSAKWAKSPNREPREFKPLMQSKDHKSTPFLLGRKGHASKLMGILSLPFQNAKQASVECRKLLPLKLWDAKLTAPPSYLTTQQQYYKDYLQLTSSPINHLFFKTTLLLPCKTAPAEFVPIQIPTVPTWNN